MDYLLRDCKWFKVYDIAEALHASLKVPYIQREFADLLNDFFCENGIGWEMREGRIVYRGSEIFAQTNREAVKVLAESSRPQAANEMQEALRDISRRPKPDITGAMQHAMTALEATARDVTGQPKPTLGQLVPALDLPEPLNIAVEKLWGYVSDRARHIREGGVVDTAEAELTVSVAGAVCTFLAKRSDNPPSSA